MRHKTLLLQLLISSMLVLFVNSKAQSQNAIASLNLSQKEKMMELGNEPNVTPSGATPLNTLHSMFPEVTDDNWYTEKKGFTTVYFKTPGKTNRVLFDKKGKIVYTISYYQKEMLPVWVLQKMNEKYAGKNIFGVTETNDNNGTSYVLVLEDQSNWFDVTIVGNEIQDVQVWNKSTP